MSDIFIKAEIVTVRYIVNDVSSSVKFYNELLEFEIAMNSPSGFAMLSNDNLRFLLNAPGAGGAGQAMPDGASPKDFKLHVEFRYPEGSNSGVYMRGRYEVQIMDSRGHEPVPGEFGGIYGFIAPSDQVAKAPGEWQTYDITLVGRMVSLVANGKTVICNQEIPGITGGALDANEGESGPIQLQGDHGPIEFRYLIITPAK